MPLGRYRVAKPKLVAKKFHFFSPRVFVTPVALYNKAGDAQRPKWQGRSCPRLYRQDMIAIGGGSQNPRCASSSRAIADISCLAQMLAPARRQSER